jgi:hypothetical protein
MTSEYLTAYLTIDLRWNVLWAMCLWVKTRADSQQNGDVLSRSNAHEEFTEQLSDY